MPRFHPLDYASCVAFLAYSSSAVLTPVCLVVLARELGFGLTAGGTIEVLRGALLVTALAGSAFVAARWGKSLSLGASLIFLGAGLFAYAAAPSFWFIVLGSVLMGLGAGVVEGLVNPLVQQLHPGDSGRYLNFVNAFWSLGALLSTLVAGDLLTREISWRWIAGGMGGFAMLSGALFLLLVQKHPEPAGGTGAGVWADKKQILRLPRFWLFAGMLFFGGAAEGTLTFWSATFVQIHHGGLPRAGGFAIASFSAGAMLGRIGAGMWLTQAQLRRTLFPCAWAGIVFSLLLLRATTLPAVFLALFACGLAISLFWPVLQSVAADRMRVETTSLFVLLSCAGIPGFASASWIMGWIAERAGFLTAFLVVPCCFAGLIVCLWLDGLGRYSHASRTRS